MLEFEHPEDQETFRQLLCDPGEALESYADLFDFRPVKEKRAEFARVKEERRTELVRRFGEVCMLHYAGDCDTASGLRIDHLIPLSTNKLNKLLRGAGTSRTSDGKMKKAPTQTLGSNGPRNLVLACHNCNSLKMNRILDRGTIKRVLAMLAGEWSLGGAMDSPKMAEFDDTRITSESRSFAADLFARFPELRHQAAMERIPGGDRWTLVLKVSAPSGDPRSELVVWVDRGDDPSVAFGDWHTHENVWGAGTEDGAEREALLDLIEGIFADRFVICEDLGGVGDGSATILDMAERDALLDELTSKYSPGRARLRSWSGRMDREVGLEDLDRNEPV